MEKSYFHTKYLSETCKLLAHEEYRYTPSKKVGFY